MQQIQLGKINDALNIAIGKIFVGDLNVNSVTSCSQ